jgi:hypothetical protein
LIVYHLLISIVEHILWQNVDQKQVEIALKKTTDIGSGLSQVNMDILGYLLREIGYRSQGRYRGRTFGTEEGT